MNSTSHAASTAFPSSCRVVAMSGSSSWVSSAELLLLLSTTIRRSLVMLTCTRTPTTQAMHACSTHEWVGPSLVIKDRKMYDI